ncbi:MAG TPA: NAD(P)/FAD-dependent oxidoreductase, partial [Planctomycetota bacterium]|nr:NAD(P)/FAD-dependent oxidoreductase [Planctomycetota bacterium]
IVREQLQKYNTVELRQIEVTDAATSKDVAPGRPAFEITLEDGKTERSRKLLIATGKRDILPPISGIEDFYGISVHHCPYCDGYEHRDQSISVYSTGKGGPALARKLTAWTRDLTLMTDGPAPFNEDEARELEQLGVRVHEGRVQRLTGNDGRLKSITFSDGTEMRCDALFFSTGQFPHSDLAARLGCDFNETECVPVGKYQVTRQPGLYVAGDASVDVQLVIVAASEGTKAAIDINETLTEEDLAAELEKKASATKSAG